MEDNRLIAINDITTADGDFVKIRLGKQLQRPLQQVDLNSRLQLVFSVSHDVTQTTRAVYNTFMLLGYVGGFSGLLYAVGSSLVGLLTYNSAENRLVEKLFTVDAAQKLQLFSKKQFAMKEYLQDLLPKCCLSIGCLRRKSRDKDFKKARERFTEEMDLVRHLQKMRYFGAAISVLLPNEQVMKLQKEAQQLPLM